MKLLMLALLGLLPVYQLLAQDIDCNNENLRRGLKKGETYISPCDSMVVLTKASYARLAMDNLLLNESLTQVEALKSSQDSLIKVLIKDASEMEQYIDATQPRIEEINGMLEKSIKNTEEAVSIARKNKLIWGGAGAGVGILLGLLLGN